jgi:hypothetical protein
MPTWLTGVLGVVGKLLVKGLELLVPYWLGKSRQRETSTEEALGKLDDAGKAIDRVRDNVTELDELRDRYRGRPKG